LQAHRLGRPHLCGINWLFSPAVSAVRAILPDHVDVGNASHAARVTRSGDRQMTATPMLWGLLVEFQAADEILRAARLAREAGYRHVDAYTPYAVEGLAAELGLRRSRIPSIVMIGGLVGAAAGFWMQYYSAAINYPLNVGGRPLNSWPVFVPIAFEVMILVA